MRRASGRRATQGAAIVIGALLVAPALLGLVAGAAGAATTPSPGDTAVTVAPTSVPPSATPTPSRTATPTQRPTPTATPTGGTTATAVPPVPSATPSATASASTAPSAKPTPTRAPQRSTQPAARRSQIGLGSVVIAVLVLAGVAFAIWLYFRRRTDAALADTDDALGAARIEQDPVQTEVLWQFLIRLGEALVASGDAVNNVVRILQRIARAYGVHDAEIIVLPTALMLTIPGAGTAQTAVSAPARAVLRLDQVDAVFDVQRRALEGTLDLREGIEDLRRARTMPPRFGAPVTVLGHALLTVGLVLILKGDAASLVLGAALGAAVGAAKLWSETRPEVRTLLPIASALAVSSLVLLLAKNGLDIEVLPAVIAPLVTFLPGGALTTSVIELAAGDMIAGASRLVLGVMQLVLLAFGIVGGAELVGLPASDVLAQGVRYPLGTIAPWIGVLVFGVGVYLHYSSRHGSLRWMLLVLYVAYSGQVLGGVLFGAPLSGLVGAMLMTPVAVFVATQPTGPPALVTFLPAFWLLVPGAIGLVGVTEVLARTRANGAASIGTTVVAIVGIALGVLLGLGVSRLLGADRDLDRRPTFLSRRGG